MPVFRITPATKHVAPIVHAASALGVLAEADSEDRLIFTGDIAKMKTLIGTFDGDCFEKVEYFDVLRLDSRTRVL
jgi:hypothetical protein